MLKKLLTAALSLALVFTLATPASASENTTENTLETAIEQVKQEYVDAYSLITEDEKDLRLKEISNKYTNEGDILSESDSAFLILNMSETKQSQESEPSTLAGYSTDWFDVYKTQFGVSVNLYGTLRQNIAYIAGSSNFGGTVILNVTSGSVKNVSIKVKHTAYGLIGTSAPYVGVLYNGDVSMTNSSPGTQVKMDKDNEYGSILPLYTTMYSQADITTSAGNQFTITSDTWKKYQ